MKNVDPRHWFLELRNRSKRLEKEVKIYIFFALLPIYILTIYEIFEFADNQAFWIMKACPIFSTLFITNLIFPFPFFIPSSFKPSHPLPEEFSLLLKFSSSLLCIVFFYYETSVQIIYPLLFDLIISLILVGSILRNYEAWNGFFHSLQKETRSFIVPKICIVVSLAFFIGLPLYQTVSKSLYHGMMMSGGNMFLMSFLWWAFRKSDFHLRREEALKIVPAQVLWIPSIIFAVFFFDNWRPDSLIIIYVILGLLLFSIASVLLGTLMFYLLSNPNVTRFLLRCINKMAEVWNYLQLEQPPEKKIGFNRENEPTNVQIFYHFLFELFFFYFFSSLIYMTVYPDGLAMTDIGDFFLSNELFIFALPIYCFIFTLTIARVSWDKKIMKASIFHKFLSISTLLSLALRLWGLCPGQIWNILLNLFYSVLLYLLIISSISFGFLSLRKYSIDRINKSKPLF